MTFILEVIFIYLIVQLFQRRKLKQWDKEIAMSTLLYFKLGDHLVELNTSLTITTKTTTNLICMTITDTVYSQLWPCRHPAKTDTPIKRTAAKSPAKTNYRRLTEINSRYYGLSLMGTLTRGPKSFRFKGSLTVIAKAIHGIYFNR